MSGGTFAVLGLYSDGHKIVDAANQIRPRKLGRLEAYTPYPVHGLDRAIGLAPSRLGRLVMFMGVMGAGLALLFEGWVSAVDYPLITGGKPLFSWQAFVPVMFEVTVLFATFTAGLAMLFAFNKLPWFGHPILHSKAIKDITRDKLALSIEATSVAFDAEAARQALVDNGAESVEIVPVPAWDRPLSLLGLLRTIAAIVAACLVAGAGLFAAEKLMPIVPPMIHMHDQPKLSAFRESSFFADGRGMRPAVEGTVARGHLPPDFATPEEAGALLGNPLPLTQAVAERGRKVFNDHCAICHGPVGDGVPLLSRAYGGKPGNFLSNEIRARPEGHLYGVLMLGKNAMPSYAADLDATDRWAVVHYIRILQRAQNAKDEDLP
ncbi:MAG: quinol:electron acceptor oxidoreductase subunit ActD [Polyangia bacterium]|jgi:mono/diheme cytochrome c family protein